MPRENLNKGKRSLKKIKLIIVKIILRKRE